jgi:hypothetical protein
MREEWTVCDQWELLPNGSWLVRINDERKPYAIAYVAENNKEHKIIVVGGHFHWDMNNLIAYKKHDEYE